MLTNLPTEGGKNIFTTFEHGDIDLEIDFLMPKGSNSGIYLMGRYEIQLFDSWGVENPGFIDCGGIYERWDESRPEGQKGYDGVPPASNASRAPSVAKPEKSVLKLLAGGKNGQKIEDAKFVEVIHNGVKLMKMSLISWSYKSWLLLKTNN
ncbi:MAG: family 16 glycoside hydrolase [Bacteroidia bacterium]